MHSIIRSILWWLCNIKSLLQIFEFLVIVNTVTKLKWYQNIIFSSTILKMMLCSHQNVLTFFSSSLLETESLFDHISFKVTYQNLSEKWQNQIKQAMREVLSTSLQISLSFSVIIPLPLLFLFHIYSWSLLFSK